MAKKLLKQSVAWITSMAIMLTAIFVPLPRAAAEEAGTTVGAFTVTGGTSGTDYTYDGTDHVLTVSTVTAITIANTDPSTPTTDTIVVASASGANITLAGVNIDVSATSDACAFRIADTVEGNVTITLADYTENTLKSGKNRAGLQKDSGADYKLEITGSGELTAAGGENGAGIGGGNQGDGSNITISGSADVTATGGYYGAGIGGGCQRSGSNITISGSADVTATGGYNAAGIGGCQRNGTDITISDSAVVTATGGDGGAGIGGGYLSSGSNITISGSADVTATGGEYGAGIGGGYSGNGENITISGSAVVTATGGKYGAGIGGGNYGSGSNITISGGTVTATGGESGAGIGGGNYGSGSNITISGGTVTATGGESGAGIGGGYDGSGENITISGGSVKAIAGDDANAIGGGKRHPAAIPTNGTADVYLFVVPNADGEAVYIDGSATPYSTADHSAADDGDTNLYLYLTGGNHTVKVGKKTYNAIFTETDGFIGSALTVTGNGLVYGTDYTYPGSTGVLTIKSNKAMTISGTTTTDKIVVDSTSGADITLDGVNIDVSATSKACAFQIASTTAGNVTVTLADGSENVLKSGAHCAGLQKDGGASYKLEITTAENTTGRLIAAGGYNGAGIGGGFWGSGSNITISGNANVTATGGYNGAGIGGGSDKTGENITISGGTVTAAGGEYGAGIGGGGSGGAGKNITISGSAVVTSTSGSYGAGIGGGYDGSGTGIAISGSAVVTATGGYYGAGIGGGGSGGGTGIAISGNTVVSATGGENGAGIGGGNGKTGENITISGGSVKAIAGESANAIGGKNASIPTDGSENVYLLKIINAGNETVTIGGTAYTPASHKAIGDEPVLYAYVTGSDKTVTVGESTRNYIFDTDTKTFTWKNADGLTITADEVTLTNDDYTYENNVLTIKTSTAVTVSGITLTDTIVVNSASGANITLDGLFIDVSETSDRCAFRIASTTKDKVTITLANGSANTLRSGANCAGLQKESTADYKLEITTAENTTGRLIAAGGSCGAGIGGDTRRGGTNITISGSAIVTATGGKQGAGIGGGRDGKGESITISGSAAVTATGGKWAAGIGGGFNGVGSTITISGGTVTATGDYNSAGIGGGNGKAGTNITISGGTVTATGGKQGAGIGGGNNSGTDITISGGTVTATGGMQGAGIGGGNGKAGTGITISGGTVTATGGTKGAGIGGGNGEAGTNITISGGTVTAKGGYGGAGIGGGSDGNGENITISDSAVVTAAGSNGGAGIGSGYVGTASNIKITGGSVKAEGSSYTDNSSTFTAPAIGGGCTSSSNGAPLTPTLEDGTSVYLLEVNTEGAEAVTINGSDYKSTKHDRENKIYAYLPAKTATTPNEIEANAITKCYYSTTREKWIKVVEAAAPVISPDGGEFIAPQAVSVTSITAGATIYYTTDGTDPTAKSTQYTGAFDLTDSAVVKAIAVRGSTASKITTATFTRKKAETPVITPNGGSFRNSQEVTITCATDGATIYYTTNGAEPTAESSVYSAAITLDETTTVKAIAVKTGMTNSEAATAKFTKLEKAATPIITPNGGDFKGTQEVTITCATDGATIYYTTDGTEPTENSMAYTGAFNITDTTTIKAIAVKNDKSDSEAATAKFTKQSSGGGNGGGHSSNYPISTNPTINGVSKSWSDIANELSKLAVGSEITIELNGNYEVPAEVIKAITDKNLKVTFVIDSWRSWTIDGADIEKPAAADFSAIQLPSSAIDGSSLRGTVGARLRIDGTNNPVTLTISFNKKYAGEFANLYRKDGDKLVFVDTVKIDENGNAQLEITDGGDYIFMLCEYSDRPGDMNNDGKLTAADASTMLKYIVRLINDGNVQMADLNGDGKINARDAVIALKKVVGLE